MKVTPERIAFIDKLKKLREKKKWSLQRLADESELAKSTIHRIEQGELNPSFDIIITLARTFKISPKDFFD